MKYPVSRGYVFSIQTLKEFIVHQTKVMYKWSVDDGFFSVKIDNIPGSADRKREACEQVLHISTFALFKDCIDSRDYSTVIVHGDGHTPMHHRLVSCDWVQLKLAYSISMDGMLARHSYLLKPGLQNIQWTLPEAFNRYHPLP